MMLLTDYEFDTLTGELTFKQPVPMLDAGGNPVSIRVTYEFNDAAQVLDERNRRHGASPKAARWRHLL